jgi:hypothetical protein
MKWQKLLASIFITLFIILTAWNIPSMAQGDDGKSGIYRGLSPVVQFDISPPLRDITPVEIDKKEITEIPERPTGLEGPTGPQDVDPVVQSSKGPALIPTPIVSFDGPPNVFSVSPPDPVGDVGPNHYVAMSNLSFQVFDKAGTSLFGPAANNTLWAGFGGDCETDNSGDPIVVYDQLADRWILTQFTASGPTYFNCVAVSTTGDPTGTYYRWAFGTGANFPDYPKYGVWPDALYISTREFAGGFAGVGAYAVDRAQLIAGNPAPTVISFLVPPGATPYNIGDGLLPTDLDGSTLPPASSPNYFVGSMDDGGGYGAPQDALTIWEFAADFAVPGNSTFTLANTIPVAAFDSVFPCSPGARDCIPQPGTPNKIDILSYRQRPMWRLAYRNFGTHEALVTNQAVEAAPNMAGIRWYEIRDPNGTPVIYQQGTYAPGITDGIHRWMGSIAMDQSGNMALGYSASDATSTFPSSWYTGRLAGDPLGTMPQGEGSIINGTGSQTGSQRWGDYTSMNVDPVDDCTFWYVNEYVPVTSSVGWQLRIGAFKFDSCGASDFTLDVDPLAQEVCIPDDALYDITVGQVQSFSDPVTLSTAGVPAGTTSSFSVNPVIPPGMSVLTMTTAAASPGSYNFDLVGTAPTSTHTTTVGLNLYDAIPAAPTLLTPADGATNVPQAPSFTWSGAAASYTIEIATDAAFTNIVDSTIVSTPSYSGALLNTSTTYYWRVTPANACGSGPTSAVWSFTTLAAPGDCGPGTAPNVLYSTGFESGDAGWTHSGIGDTWALSSINPHSGSMAFHADDVSSVSDQQLVSPAVLLPTGQDPLSLQFWNYQELEDITSGGCYDGGILEVSDNGGATWTQVLDPALLTDPYDGLVDGGFGNPLAGLPAWCGDPQPYLNSIVDLSAYAGQTVNFRFRLGTDSSVSHPGWDIDDVVVQSCIPTAAISLQKTVGTDPGICAATNTIAVAPGTDVYYCYEITNTGGITLALHDLADDQLGTILSGFAFDLAPGASVDTVAAGLTLSATITGTTTNTATWTAYNPGPTDVVSTTASATVDLLTRLQVAHLAPFAMDPGTAVTITLNGSPALTNFAYTDSTVYLDLIPDTYLVEIFPGGSATPAITGTVDLMGGVDYTAIAIGDGVNQPLSLLALVDDNTAPAAGNFKLRLGHLAPFTDTITGTLADVRLDDGTAVITDVPYGAVSPYLELPAGTYDLKITTPGGGTTLINLAPVTFTDGDILSAFATGDGVNQPLGGYALPSGQLGFVIPLEEYKLYLPLAVKN